jgi:tetratricopeptide (TPR) repeat protein
MYDEAITELKKALSINAYFEKAYYNLGNAYAKTGMFNEAITQYGKALSINPEFALAHHGLAVTYAKRQMFDEAISELVKAKGLGLRVDPRLLQELSEASEREKRVAGP